MLKNLSVSLSLILCISLVSFAEAQTDEQIKSSFQAQSINLSDSDLSSIRPLVKNALQARCSTSQPNSRVGFSAVELATQLKLNPRTDSSIVSRINTAISALPCYRPPCSKEEPCTNMPYPGGNPERPIIPPRPQFDWLTYFNQTINLNSNAAFLNLIATKNFHPVKISWEDISRYQGSVWGDRISDVGIWVRLNETDPQSAQLALSVRRDSNYRDKVLMVPAEKIKIHKNNNGQTTERTLPERLRELGLTSATKDKYVIVSNQFAIVPVPANNEFQPIQRGGGDLELLNHPSHGNGNAYPYHGVTPARVAFNFSIFPYGSTNFVITDVIEGSSEAIVGPGDHQLLYANVNGQKAPFTASRASERPDLLALESELKSKGMDVDVQRYYLIQIPLKRETSGVVLSNMGTPPFSRHYSATDMEMTVIPPGAGSPLVSNSAVNKSSPYEKDKKAAAERSTVQSAGLEKVAIGHGENEGPYNPGSGYRGKREDSPIRVTVIYFVTPRGELTSADMETFSQAFETWDNQAIWGGSFVEPGQ